MTDDRSLERAARTWLEEGPSYAPDRPVEAALARIETTHQERGPLLPWRLPTMHPIVRYAAAALVAVVAIGAALYLLGDGGGGIGTTPPTVSAEPSADPTPTPTPRPTPVDNYGEYSSWTYSASEVYGIDIGHPVEWTVVPAARQWQFETDAADVLSEGADGFLSPDGHIRVTVWTVPVQGGTTLREWVEAYCSVNTTPCDALDGRLEPVFREVADRHLAGVVIEFQADVQAFMPAWAYDTDLDAIWTDPAPAEGSEITVIAGWRPADEFDSREVVDGFSLLLCPDSDCGSQAGPSAAP
jgi:hypothetical protein